MLKKKIIYLAGVALFTAGLRVAANTHITEAAVANPIKQGKKLSLTRSTYVYNKDGVRVGRLKKGNLCKVYIIKVINGNSYVKVGKKRFVKQEAFLPYVKSTTKVENQIKKSSFVYDENGEKINYLGHKEINEKPFIKIGDGEYVKAFNVLTIMINN